MIQKNCMACKISINCQVDLKHDVDFPLFCPSCWGQYYAIMDGYKRKTVQYLIQPERLSEETLKDEAIV